MKKEKKLLKSLKAIPLGIFAYEIVNLIISLKNGLYLRMEMLDIKNGFELKNVFIAYIACSITSYLTYLYFLGTTEIQKSEKSIEAKRKETYKYTIPLLVFLVLFIILIKKLKYKYAIAYGVLIPMSFGMVVGTVYLIKGFIDKYSIKEINKKLKETIKK